MSFGAFNSFLSTLKSHYFLGPFLLALGICSSLSVAADEFPWEEVSAIVNAKTGLKAYEIHDSEMEGFNTVILENGDVIYVSDDLQWFILGDLLEAKSPKDSELFNHTEAKRKQQRADWIKGIDKDSLISFEPMFEDKRAEIYVFTDTTCGYCRKLHTELSDYHEYGIEIHYLAYPRAGKDSEAYDDMVSAWCATKPQMAMTQLKLGNKIEAKTCENPVDSHMQFAQLMGLRGTPLIVLPNGVKIGGYVPAAELEQVLSAEGLL